MLSRRASNPNIRVYSTINFAPRRPVDFVNFRGAGQHRLFAGRGGAACCPAGQGGAGRGGEIIPDLYHLPKSAGLLVGVSTLLVFVYQFGASADHWTLL